jgi:hypothetical protein
MTKQVYAYWNPDTVAWRIMSEDSTVHLMDAASVIIGYVAGEHAVLGQITASGAYFASSDEAPEGSDTCAKFKAFFLDRMGKEGWPITRHEGVCIGAAESISLGRCHWIYCTIEGGKPVRYVLHRKED